MQPVGRAPHRTAAAQGHRFQKLGRGVDQLGSEAAASCTGLCSEGPDVGPHGSAAACGAGGRTTSVDGQGCTPGKLRRDRV